MGNITAGDQNKTTVTLRIRHFHLSNVGKIPSKWKVRVDQEVWDEFCHAMRKCSKLDDQKAINWQFTKGIIKFFVSFVMIVIGCIIGGVGGGVGGGNDDKGVWIPCVVIGGLVFIFGMILIFVSSNEIERAKNRYKNGVQDKIHDELSILNDKYKNIIYFNLRIGSMAKNNIKIGINIKTEFVTYISDKNVAPIMQYQIPSQQVNNMNQPLLINENVNNKNNQIIQIKMPDGNVVSARIVENMDNNYGALQNEGQEGENLS